MTPVFYSHTASRLLAMLLSTTLPLMLDGSVYYNRDHHNVDVIKETTTNHVDLTVVQDEVSIRNLETKLHDYTEKLDKILSSIDSFMLDFKTIYQVDGALKEEAYNEKLEKKKSCKQSWECNIGERCDYTWKISYGSCSSLLPEGEWCNSHSECISNFCGFGYECLHMRTPCNTDADCTITGRCEDSSIESDFDTTESKFCADLGRNGEICRENADCASNSCGSDGKCHAKKYKGKPCVSDSDCKRGTTCSSLNNKCYSNPRKIGDPCTTTQPCFTGLECGPSGACEVI